MKNRSGLIGSNPIVGQYITKTTVKEFTKLIDVKTRHTNSHPNLLPSLLLKKLFLIRRAAHQTGMMECLAGVHLCIQLALAVMGSLEAKKYLEEWNKAGDIGWGKFEEADLVPYANLL